MIERHVTFHVLPELEGEFVRFFGEEYRPALKKIEGFVQAGLLRDSESERDFLMTLRFTSAETAAAWRASEAHQVLKPHLKSLYEGSELKVLEVVVDE
jgi:heme-degrading monooxygenase HmoA